MTRCSSVFCLLCQPCASFCGIAVEFPCSDLKANPNQKKKKKFLQGLVPCIDSPLGQKSHSAFKRKGVRKCGRRGERLQDSLQLNVKLAQ